MLDKAEAHEYVLQQEQLPLWFEAIRAFPNPVLTAYLQVMLLKIT